VGEMERGSMIARGNQINSHCSKNKSPKLFFICASLLREFMLSEGTEKLEVFFTGIFFKMIAN
jgi:hypothetical protein